MMICWMCQEREGTHSDNVIDNGVYTKRVICDCCLAELRDDGDWEEEETEDEE